ncbi:MAG: UpxY family transcription antiterminator [Bryobacterales bacterium]|nr:UpxY family transcription antiterminator [Bryobacterales bacterium]MBV9397650.1 UpxY family transcription antiterminator [Bryobacterales bacterium]
MSKGFGLSTAAKNTPVISAEKQSWYGLRVRSNFERQVSQLLRAKDIQEYLPLYKTRRAWSDRVREIELPLIPGYVFCRIALESRPKVLATTGVVGLAGSQNQPLPIDERELAAVRKMAETQSTVEPWPFLRIGQRVRVHRGPLTGVEGILLKVKSSYRLVVSVTLLGRGVASEIDAAYVRPL